MVNCGSTEVLYYYLLQMMEVLRDGSELVFLYQLVKGHSNNSLACHIASVAGLPQELVERGSEVSPHDIITIQILNISPCCVNYNGSGMYVT